jgi:chitinase
VALGGWTFNDNGTATQPVFSEMVSSPANRQKFIANLLSFFREFAFDGVDFDWVSPIWPALRSMLTAMQEYPGAPDRGGTPQDAANFAVFLKELREAIAAQPVPYVVSFTIPTSYWYLRGFDLKAVEYADWVNVMSYE